MSAGPASVNPSTVAPYMSSLMLRNIATFGFMIADHNEPGNPGGYTAPGCVLASPSWPSYPGNVAPIIEDYVFNWTRDAAITMSAVLNQAPAQIRAAGASDLLASYVDFASTCQASGGDVGQAHYTPEGGSTGSSDESDGPALRILTILQGFAGLNGPTQTVARNVIAADLAYLLENSRYQNPTYNLWEDTFGQSIFARSVQLAALNQVINLGPGLGIPVPPTAQAAATWLGQQLPLHWSGAPDNCYVGVLSASRGGAISLRPMTQASIQSWRAYTEPASLLTIHGCSQRRRRYARNGRNRRQPHIRSTVRTQVLGSGRALAATTEMNTAGGA